MLPNTHDLVDRLLDSKSFYETLLEFVGGTLSPDKYVYETEAILGDIVTRLHDEAREARSQGQYEKDAS